MVYSLSSANSVSPMQKTDSEQPPQGLPLSEMHRLSSLPFLVLVADVPRSE